MRQFNDEQGGTWTATIAEEESGDYKGQYFFAAESTDGEHVALRDVRWNSIRTAQRTLETMSEVELRRRLRSARGRSGVRRPA